MGFKQTNEELDANKAKVDKAFLPAVLGAKAWVDLLPSMSRWLLNNCTFDGFTDGSVANMIRAINALDGTGLFDWQIAPLKTPPKKQPDFQQSNDGGRSNHARREEKAKVVQLAANDVNSPIFQYRNAEAKAQFEDLCERGPISYRHGRIDRGLTEARREKLVAIRVIAAQRDKEGQQVPIYSKMLEEAQRLVGVFESENSRREMS
jgi:hypothetical protein